MKAALLTAEIPEDVTGWWCSEKYDGVRAIWTGTNLLSRNGHDLNAPAWFTAGLPKDVRLDGELWIDRGKFDELVSVLQKKDSDWSKVKYMVFEIAGEGSFEDRHERLLRTPLPFHAFRVVHSALTDHNQLNNRESAIVGLGGEGCVIRRPGSKYRPGRMGDTIKVKRLARDVDRWQG